MGFITEIGNKIATNMDWWDIVTALRGADSSEDNYNPNINPDTTLKAATTGTIRYIATGGYDNNNKFWVSKNPTEILTNLVNDKTYKNTMRQQWRASSEHFKAHITFATTAITKEQLPGYIQLRNIIDILNSEN